MTSLKAQVSELCHTSPVADKDLWAERWAALCKRVNGPDPAARTELSFVRQGSSRWDILIALRAAERLGGGPMADKVLAQAISRPEDLVRPARRALVQGGWVETYARNPFGAQLWRLTPAGLAELDRRLDGDG